MNKLNVTRERYKLFPLWYTAAYHYKENSDPLVTPLWYDYPEEDFHDVRFQTILDHKLMAAPAVHEAARIVVQLLDRKEVRG